MLKLNMVINLQLYQSFILVLNIIKVLEKYMKLHNQKLLMEE